MLRKWSKGGKISNWKVIRATANYKQSSDARVYCSQGRLATYSGFRHL
jgi:hypothetical protein